MADDDKDIRKWVRAHPEDDVETLAIRALQKHRPWVLSLVVQEIDHMRRHEIRETEVEQFDALIRELSPLAVSRPAVPDGDAIMAFMGLLRSPFKLGDGTSVTWGEATIEQHQQRKDMLEMQVRGLQDTASRHAQAIERLRETGAKCLDDLVAQLAR